MNLTVREITEETLKNGQQAGIVIDAGQSLKIETKPGGIEILNEEVPAGKEWNAVVTVAIVETDI